MALSLVWSLVSWKAASNIKEYEGRKIFTLTFRFNWHFPIIISAIFLIIYFIIVRASNYPINPKIIGSILVPPLLIVGTKYFWLEAKLTRKLAMEAPPKQPEEGETPLIPIWYATLLKEVGEPIILTFPSQGAFYNWYNKIEDWRDIKEVRLDEKLGSPQELGLPVSPARPAPKLLEEEFSKLKTTIKVYKPPINRGKYNSVLKGDRLLLGEVGTTGDLARFLRTRGYECEPEVTLREVEGIRVDLLVMGKYVIEAKEHLMDTSSRRDLESKLRALERHPEYQPLVLVYRNARNYRISDLAKALDSDLEIIVLGDILPGRGDDDK